MKYHAATIRAPIAPVTVPSRTVECLYTCMAAPPQSGDVLRATPLQSGPGPARGMCRGSLSAAALAGAGGEQPLEGIDAGAMAVAPLDTEAVGTDQRDR